MLTPDRNKKRILLTAMLIFSVSLSLAAEELEHADIENAVILNNLSMQSEEFLKDPEMLDGQIIIDNKFDDEIKELKKAVPQHKTVVKPRKPRKPRKHKIKTGRRAARKTLPFIQQLKKKDNRWHLSQYTIKKNDNLWKISRRFNTDHRFIIEANNIKKPDRLLPGKKILIPNRHGVTYKIKKGDTVWGISRKYKLSTKKVLAANNLKKKRLLIGRTIFLPDAKEIRNPHHYKAQKKRTVARHSKKIKKSKAVKQGLAFTWPLRGRITSGFGTRKDPFSGKKSFHCGIDISANSGNPVRSSEKGKVIFSGWKTGYGKVVIIRHTGGYISVYAHNSKNIVKKNHTVKKNQLIALSGMTGAVTGAHLHFEIRKYLTPLNPLRILKK